MGWYVAIGSHHKFQPGKQTIQTSTETQQKLLQKIEHSPICITMSYEYRMIL